VLDNALLRLDNGRRTSDNGREQLQNARLVSQNAREQLHFLFSEKDFLLLEKENGETQSLVRLREPLLRRPSVQLVREVQQEGYMQVALGFLDFRTRENGKAFAVRVQVENPNKVRQ
jgi:hypothetical protein